MGLFFLFLFSSSASSSPERTNHRLKSSPRKRKKKKPYSCFSMFGNMASSSLQSLPSRNWGEEPPTQDELFQLMQEWQGIESENGPVVNPQDHKGLHRRVAHELPERLDRLERITRDVTPSARDHLGFSQPDYKALFVTIISAICFLQMYCRTVIEAEICVDKGNAVVRLKPGTMNERFYNCNFTMWLVRVMEAAPWSKPDTARYRLGRLGVSWDWDGKKGEGLEYSGEVSHQGGPTLTAGIARSGRALDLGVFGLVTFKALDDEDDRAWINLADELGRR
ncbi:hypothetical protein GGR50DRAFT_35488 [Xylaria sp. CBS 124048]|nr:hypothetical protein GGR50DRAFT_35488 [Xylaria sp. CBS 124048]